MRWWSIVVCVLFGAASAVELNQVPKNTSHASYPVTITIGASVFSDETALALQEIAVLTLQRVELDARPAPALPACQQANDTICYKAILSALHDGSLSAAITAVPAESMPSVTQLWDYGIEEINDLMPASRRACLATTKPAKSLLDLSDFSTASRYHISKDDIDLLLNDGEERSSCNSSNCTDNIFTPRWCEPKSTCTTILTSSSNEVRVISNVILTHKLYATVRALGTNLQSVVTKLSDRSVIVCDWAPEVSLPKLKPEQHLSPPPCLPNATCPFETRRIVKYFNKRALAQLSKSAIRTFARLKLTTSDLTQLDKKVFLEGLDKAAGYFGEVRVAVLVPNSTEREGFDARALAAAAVLAELDIAKDEMLFGKIKMELYDDGCDSTRANKYLQDAQLGTGEFHRLSALSGPACSAVWSDVAHQATNYRLPMLAYTLQTPAEVPNNDTDYRLQLLAGGDAREAAAALTALSAKLSWRRAAVLSEPATRPLADQLRAHTDLTLPLELTIRPADNIYDLVDDWMKRVVAANVHVVYLCVEDVRIARAAVCAAAGAGAQRLAWLLCAAPAATAWLTAPTDFRCTTDQLHEVADGYISVAPEWETRWEDDAATASEQRRAWQGALASRLEPRAAAVGAVAARAALLYDSLRLWAAALARQLAARPAAADQLHSAAVVEGLIQDVVTTNYTGLTGSFEWRQEGAAYARVVPFVLTQWGAGEGGGVRRVGRWAAGELELDEPALHWPTPDGRAPDDGSEHCALQGMADAMNSSCRTAFLLVGGLVAVTVLAALGALALHCRRRAERKYRARLAALSMRPLPSKALDRWEVPRERVVINRKLGTGAFGTVYGGHALLAEDRGWSAVAVKTLKAGADTEEKIDFLSEAEAMKRFDHKNVVKLLAVVTKTEPVCTVMEFMLYGDLKNYLLARRHLAAGGAEAEGEADEASPRRLTGMALDVARALSYLAQLRYVHRDVAARNCLVSARRVVKLADFGMTRLVFENDYYRFSRKGMLPVRWMAPESLALGVFSPASDVWSFGVLLYEIVTFGSLPFQGHSNSEVLARVKAGHTLELPIGLKPQLEGLIRACWQRDSKVRPTASEVAAFLADTPRLLTPCLDVPLDALSLDLDPPWRLPRDQAEARWVSWAAPASAATDTTYLSADGAIPLDTDTFLP